MKYLLVSDIHLGKNSNSESTSGNKNLGELFLNHTIDALDFMFNKHKSTVDAIAILGDLNDRQVVSDHAVMKRTIEFFDRHQDIDIYILIGNHDIYFRNTNKVNSIDYLARIYPNVKIVPEAGLLKDNVLMVNWITDENRDNLTSLMNSTGADYLFGHFDVVGANLGSGRISEHGFEPSDFSKFKRVYTGHYHTQSEISNIVYLGNPIQTKISEHDEKKGVVIFDSVSGEWYRDNYDLKVFHRISYSDVYGKVDFSEYQKSVVELTIDKSDDTYDLVEHERLISEIKKECIDLRVILKNISKISDTPNLSKSDISSPISILNEEMSKYELSDTAKSFIHNLFEEAKGQLEE